MAHNQGYNQMADSPVSYPSTYNDARNAAFSSAAAVGGNLNYAADVGDAPPQGRGRGGRGGTRPPKVQKPYSCVNKHPIQALKELRPNAKFEVICQYLTNNGAALVVTTTIDNVVYQGEGTNGQNARTIAAHKAVVGLDAAGHEQLITKVDFAEQKNLVMERITQWQEEQAKKDTKKVTQEKVRAEQEQLKVLAAQKKAEKKQGMEDQPPVKKVKNNDGNSSAVGQQQTYGTLIHRYGPNIVDNTVQTEETTELNTPMFKCTLTIQDIPFEAVAPSKKGARNDAVLQAFEQFAQTPPPVVNEKKRKTPRKTEVNEYIPIEPVDLQDKIAKKCWDFVNEQTASIADTYKYRRNLVCIVKVQGEETVENCEVVAFGNGTLVIKKDNMTPDGTTINDSTGESLALRALRRYLLDQVDLCLSNKGSVYTRDRTGGKCSLKKDVKLYMYTNSAPMGDSRAISEVKQELPMETETPAAEAAPVEAAPVEAAPTDVTATNVVAEPMDSTPAPVTPKQPFFRKGWRRRAPKLTPTEDLGKIQLFVNTANKEEATEVFGENSHSIVSPSDKLAVRQMVGIQGSVLFSISQPIFISQYLVNRTYNDTAFTRALYDRVKDAKVAARDVGPAPEFRKVMWKATRREERKTPWSLIWAQGHAVEIISAAEGKQFVPKEGEEQPTPDSLVNYLAQSEFCTKALFTSYVNVCKKYKKSYPQKYSVAKYANTRYRQVKNAVITHLQETGMGAWPERICKPDY